jgi:pimeloyl-ACP methyl ester carboxylesterase
LARRRFELNRSLSDGARNDKDKRMDLHEAKSFEGKGHTIPMGRQHLFLWEKAPHAAPLGTILFVHGSSMASTPGFDLQVPGRPEASPMNWFASRGFNTWCFDCRGYGRSSKEPDIVATIDEGAEDAAAASEYIMSRSATGPLLVYGISSGALRAALFTQRHPDRVRRLALDAMVWTGRGSPTLEQRTKNLAKWRETTRRPIDRAFLNSIYERDLPGTGLDELIQPFIEQCLELDSSVPNGTYIDMCVNLPVVDPRSILVPTVIMRGEHDGIASLDDLVEFFKLLPNNDKQITVTPGVAHSSFRQKNFLMVYQTLLGFFMRPPKVYG